MVKRMLREPTGPGEILLEEFLLPMGLSQSEFARHIGWTQPKVNEIVNGKRGVTPQTAMVLADAFGTTARFWLNLQVAVDLWRAEQKHKPVKKLSLVSKK
jgi:addiction module HigA family antidote